MLNINTQAIGIFDSGVGGLSILKAVHELMPNENLIYVADSAYMPYGERTVEQIEHRVTAITEFLVTKGVKALVVACNTATAAAINSLRDKFVIPIIGLEPALKPAAEASHCKRVGVLATQATLKSQKYLELKHKFAQQLQVVEKASSLFVKLVEESPVIDQAEYSLIKSELAPFKIAQVDSLVLGCTHYPFLTEAIEKIMGPNVTLFESSLPVAKEVQRRLTGFYNNKSKLGELNFYSTEPQKAQATFDRILKMPIKLQSLTLK